MSNLIIGDVHGCYNELMHLLDKVKFSDNDILWLTGDLVNKGPNSLEVLRFVKRHQSQIRTVLGNHDIHLINSYQNYINGKKTEKFMSIITANDGEELIKWLQIQPFLILDENINLIVTHAGFSPEWDLQTAKACNQALMQYLKNNDSLSTIYKNKPNKWHQTNTLIEKLIYSINAFTRMRYCKLSKKLDFDCKLNPKEAPKNLRPWFDFKLNIDKKYFIAFGHWSSLKGEKINEQIYALDTGCCWGGALTCMRFEDKQYFSVNKN